MLRMGTERQKGVFVGRHTVKCPARPDKCWIGKQDGEVVNFEPD